MMKLMKKITNTKCTAIDAWLEFITDVHCGLCGNSGFINTTKSAITPMGKPCGIKAYCICPNGRALKKQATRQKKWGGSSIID